MTYISRTDRIKEWLRRYIPAEIIGTLCALLAAWITFDNTHSYVTAAAAGWIGEGAGFFGYFISVELIQNARKYNDLGFSKRVLSVIATASTNLIIEFLPAEIIDNLIVRPFAMYLIPQYIHPYAIGFLVAKFSADILFYALAIVGYEMRKRWRNHIH